MTWKLRPRPHRHDRANCWCDPPTDFAGVCAHKVGALDQCDTCCPPEETR